MRIWCDLRRPKTSSCLFWTTGVKKSRPFKIQFKIRSIRHIKPRKPSRTTLIRCKRTVSTGKGAIATLTSCASRAQVRLRGLTHRAPPKFTSSNSSQMGEIMGYSINSSSSNTIRCHRIISRQWQCQCSSRSSSNRLWLPRWHQTQQILQLLPPKTALMISSSSSSNHNNLLNNLNRSSSNKWW